jgi:hypothetical protein
MMKKATKATKGYAETFRRLVADGYCLTHYGHGLRYFSRRRGDGKYDCATVDVRGKIVESGVSA